MVLLSFFTVLGLNQAPEDLGNAQTNLPCRRPAGRETQLIALLLCLEDGGQLSVHCNRLLPFPPAGAEQGRPLSRACGWMLLTRCFCKAQPHLCLPVPMRGKAASHLPATSASPVEEGLSLTTYHSPAGHRWTWVGEGWKAASVSGISTLCHSYTGLLLGQGTGHRWSPGT